MQLSQLKLPPNFQYCQLECSFWNLCVYPGMSVYWVFKVWNFVCSFSQTDKTLPVINWDRPGRYSCTIASKFKPCNKSIDIHLAPNCFRSFSFSYSKRIQTLLIVLSLPKTGRNIYLCPETWVTNTRKTWPRISKQSMTKHGGGTCLKIYPYLPCK